MIIKRLNWQLWLGFLVSLFAFISFFTIFVWFPTTRDFPWVNLLLFAAATVLLLIGLRRPFIEHGPRRSKITASIVTCLGLIVFAFFVFTFFIGGRQLPTSSGAPQVGHKAPDFTLADINNKQVTLAELLSTPINGKAPKGVLLIFYRGYW